MPLKPCFDKIKFFRESEKDYLYAQTKRLMDDGMGQKEAEIQAAKDMQDDVLTSIEEIHDQLKAPKTQTNDTTEQTGKEAVQPSATENIQPPNTTSIPAVEPAGKTTPEKSNTIQAGEKVTFEWLGEKMHGDVYAVTPDRIKVRVGNTNYPMKYGTVTRFKESAAPAPKKTAITAEKISKDLDEISQKSTPIPNANKASQANVSANPLKILRSLFGGLNQAQDAVFGRFFRKIEDIISKHTQNGLKNTNYAVRNSVGTLQNVIGGLAYTSGDLKNKLDFMGNKNYAHLKANILLKELYKVIGSDMDALANVHRALDPEVYVNNTQQGQVLLDEKDALEKDIRSKHREIERQTQAGAPITTIDALETELMDLHDDLTAKNVELKAYTDQVGKDAQSTLNAKENYLYDIIRKTNDYIHEWYHDQGLISDETYDENKGTYIARLYENYELEDPEITKMYQASRADFDMLKTRKEFEDVKAILLRDPVFATAKRVAQMMQTQAIFEYAETISQSKNIKVSDGPFEKSLRLGEPGGKPFYGALTGKFVPDFIAQDFKGFYFGNKIFQHLYESFSTYDRLIARQFFKKLHTIFNPLVQLGNKLASYSFAFWSGIDPFTFAQNRYKARLEIKNQGQYFHELVKTGMIGTDILTTELVPAQISKNDQLQGVSKGVVDVFNQAKKVYNKASEKASRFYSKVDDTSKLAAYISLVEDYHFSKEQAQAIIYESFQNYATVGKLYDFAAKTPIIGNPYIKFKGDLMRILKNSVTRRPLTTALYLGVLIGLKDWLSDLSDEDEDVKKVRERRAFIPKIPTPFGDIPMVWQVPHAGEVNFARYLTPFYIYDRGDSDSPMDLTDWLPYQAELLKISPSKDITVPVPKFQDVFLGPYAEAIFDRDFRGKSIRDPEGNDYISVATPEEQLFNTLNYIARSQVPMYASARDMMSAYRGEPDVYNRQRTILQAISNNIIKVQEFGSEEARKSLEKEISYKVNQIAGLEKDINDLINYSAEKIGEINKSNSTNKEQRLEDERKALVKRVLIKAKEQKEVVQSLEDPVKLLKVLIGKQ